MQLASRVELLMVGQLQKNLFQSATHGVDAKHLAAHGPYLFQSIALRRRGYGELNAAIDQLRMIETLGRHATGDDLITVARNQQIFRSAQFHEAAFGKYGDAMAEHLDLRQQVRAEKD